MLRQEVRKAPVRVPNLYPSYGLFHAGAAATDLLTLVFIARIIQTSPQQLSILDSMSTYGNIFAALGFGLVAGRLAPSRPILAASLIAAALSIILLAASSTMWMAYALAFLVGIFNDMPRSVVPWYLSSKTPRAKWGEVYSKLATAGSLGGAIGIAFSFAWLAATQHWQRVGFSEQTLLVFWGAATLVAAIAGWKATAGSQSGRTHPALRVFHLGSRFLLSPQEHPHLNTVKGELPQTRRPSMVTAFRDVWIVHSVVPAILFVGLGMSYTGTILYLFDDLKSPWPLVFTMLLLVRITSWLTSAGAARLLTKFTPLRVHQVAAIWRILAVLGLSLVLFFPKSLWSIPIVAVLFAICGAAGAVLSITEVLAVTEATPKRHHGTAIFLFNGVSNAGAGIGSGLAGLIGQQLNLPAALAVSGVVVGFALWLQHRY